LNSENESLQLELAHGHQLTSSLESEYQQKIVKLQQQVRDQSSQMEQSLSTCEDLNKELEETKQVITMLEGSLRNQQKIHHSEAQEFKSLQALYSKLEGEKDSLISQLDTIYKEMSDRLSEIKDLKKQSSEGEAKVVLLSDNNKQLEKSLAHEKEKVTNAEREVEKKEALLSSMKQRLVC
jgi:chromosome segregation ATPase